MKNKRKLILLGMLVIVLLIIDRLTKNLAETYLSNRIITIIPSFFELRLAYNPGAGWSILSNQRWLLIAISALTSAVLTYLVYTEKRVLLKTSYSVILAGAMGNLIDRAATGLVIDFLQFYPLRYPFPTFNVADMCIVIGTGMLLLDFYLQEKEASKHGK